MFESVMQRNPAKTKKIRELLGASGVKQDALQREQLAVWFSAVQQVFNPVTSAYLETVLLIGARPGEVLEMRWEDIDVGARYRIFRPAKLPKLTLAEGEFVITKARSILDVMSGLTEETINVLLAAHRKQPHALIEHFKMALPPRVAAKTRSFVEMMTRKVKPEQPVFSFIGVVA
jgi:integrase